MSEKAPQRKVLAATSSPIEGHERLEVREDKNGNPYFIGIDVDGSQKRPRESAILEAYGHDPSEKPSSEPLHPYQAVLKAQEEVEERQEKLAKAERIHKKSKAKENVSLQVLFDRVEKRADAFEASIVAKKKQKEDPSYFPTQEEASAIGFIDELNRKDKLNGLEPITKDDYLYYKALQEQEAEGNQSPQNQAEAQPSTPEQSAPDQPKTPEGDTPDSPEEGEAVKDEQIRQILDLQDKIVAASEALRRSEVAIDIDRVRSGQQPEFNRTGSPEAQAEKVRFARLKRAAKKIGSLLSVRSWQRTESEDSSSSESADAEAMPAEIPDNKDKDKPAEPEADSAEHEEEPGDESEGKSDDEPEASDDKESHDDDSGASKEAKKTKLSKEEDHNAHKAEKKASDALKRIYNGGASAEEPGEEPKQSDKPEDVRVLSPEETQAKKREKLKSDGVEVALSNGGVATILGREIVGSDQELFVIAVGDRDIVTGKRWLKENLDPESEVDYDNVPLIRRASKPKKSSTEQEDKPEQPAADDSEGEPELSDEPKNPDQSTSVRVVPKPKQ